jgi:hypothetical protein
MYALPSSLVGLGLVMMVMVGALAENLLAALYKVRSNTQPSPKHSSYACACACISINGEYRAHRNETFEASWHAGISALLPSAMNVVFVNVNL